MSVQAAFLPEQHDLRLAQAGQREAFDRLVRRHQGAVRRLARNVLGHDEDALDVAQETFLKVYLHLPGFRGNSSLRTWILRIALNTARSFRSRQQARKRSPGGVPPLSLAQAGEVRDQRAYTGPVRTLERRELEEALGRALGALEASQRSLLLDRSLGNQPYELLAARRRLPVGTVKSKVHRARNHLRASLTGLL